MLRPRVCLVLLLLGGCSRPATTTPPSADAAAAAPAPAPAKAASADAAVVARAVGMGIAELTPPSTEATRNNDAAVALLAKGKVDDAIAGFEKALALAPSFVLARYNLACARARANDLEGAERELAAVFAADWVGLRAQAAKDADLATFRTSTQGKRLFATEGELEPLYRTEIEHGVRVLYWPSKDPKAIAADGIRLGIWDAASTRFVAISERRRGTISAFVSVDGAYAALLTGGVPTMLGGDMSDHVVVGDVSLWSFDTSGRPVGTMKVDKGAFAGALLLTGTNALLSMTSGYGFDWTDPSKNALEMTFSPSEGTKTKILATARDWPPPDPAQARGRLDLHFHNGFETWSAPAGYAYDDKKHTLRLPSGDTIELAKSLFPKAYRVSNPSIAASPKGDLVALSWDSHWCKDECGGDLVTVGEHRIVLVDRRARAAQLIAEGTGIGAARFDASGRLFVQRDRTTFDAGDHPDDASTWRELPAGVLLVAPVRRGSDVQCCGF